MGAVLALGAAVSSCSQVLYIDLPATAYRHFGDRLSVYFDPFFGSSCARRELEQISRSKSVEDCFRFGQSRQMRGVIVTTNFGPARFAEGAVKATDRLSQSSAIVATRYLLRAPDPLGLPSGSATRAFAVEFDGRETAGGRGKMMGSVVIVDKIDRARRLAVPKDVR